MYKSSDDLEKPGETVMASGRKARQLTGNLKVVEENKSLTALHSNEPKHWPINGHPKTNKNKTTKNADWLLVRRTEIY